MKKQTTVPENEAEIKTDPSLSRKKRVALVIYLAILFIVALAVVTLSLVIQIHKNTEENNTFAEKAQTLQEENEELRQEIALLQKDNDTLTKENDSLTAENATLTDENDALKKQNEDTVKAYDLLAQAKAALDAEDDDAFRAAMDELAPLSDILSAQAKTEYNELLDAMADHTPEP